MNTKEIANAIKEKMGKKFSESTFYACIKDYENLSEEEISEVKRLVKQILKDRNPSYEMER